MHSFHWTKPWFILNKHLSTDTLHEQQTHHMNSLS
jgi:hypothetical protein